MDIIRSRQPSLLTFAVYMMCEHPEIASRLRLEIIEKVGPRAPTYEDIRDMKYLRAFLNGTLIDESLSVFPDHFDPETLRLYPSV